MKVNHIPHRLKIFISFQQRKTNCNDMQHWKNEAQQEKEKSIIKVIHKA
jgi:hypothetical protein